MRCCAKIIVLLLVCGHSRALVREATMDDVTKLVQDSEVSEQRSTSPEFERSRRDVNAEVPQQGLPVIGGFVGSLPPIHALQGVNWLAIPSQLLQGLPLNLGNLAGATSVGNLGAVGATGTTGLVCPSAQKLSCKCEPLPVPKANSRNLGILQYSELNHLPLPHPHSEMNVRGGVVQEPLILG